ncbi:MAG: nitrilase-related carbon-nitrogen hydrolase, partial [Candidatus Cryptobacteroides sp.]
MMKIAVIQADILWGDIAGNIGAARTMLDKAPEADLYLLPEMFTTGFNSNCENIPSGGLAFLQEEARKRDCAVAGSIALGLEDGMRVNRFYFVTPDSVTFYDKRHLFNYGGEGRQYRAGDRRVIAEWKGVR